jgi:hypothetical protein
MVSDSKYWFTYQLLPLDLPIVRPPASGVQVSPVSAIDAQTFLAFTSESPVTSYLHRSVVLPWCSALTLVISW